MDDNETNVVDHLCWWCGDTADSYEHKYKKSHLRRIAGPEGPQSLFKSSHSYQGVLKSLNKGAQVRWEKVLCSPCNNAKSQSFDRAYDQFVDYYMRRFNRMKRSPGIDWREVYGDQWRKNAADLSRYLGKQFGCMLASNNFSVPTAIPAFLNGAEDAGSFVTLIYRNWRAIRIHKLMMRDDPESDGMKTYIGLPSTHYYTTDGQLSRATYELDIGYLKFTAEWRDQQIGVSMHDVPRISMPLLYGSRKERREWYRAEHHNFGNSNS